jgi:hypothetical protein
MNIAVPNLLMKSDAKFSECRKYRYTLWRIWEEEDPYCAFIGLNPSTADIQYNDPTIQRCVNNAMDWGFGGLLMLNLFAYRSTDPQDLYKQEDPIGEENDKCITDLVKNSGMTIAAWGNHGKYLDRDKSVLKMLSTIKEIHCLDTNKDESPKHPLYIPKSKKPFLYRAKNE